MDHEFAIPLIEDIDTAISTLGLHLSDVDMAVIPVDNDLEDIPDEEMPSLLKNGDAKLFISAMFSVSNVAWSDKVLDPESHKIQRDFKMAAPTEFEVELESLKDIVDNWDTEE